MKKAVIICLLSFFAIAPLAPCAIDTAVYSRLSSDIIQKESQLNSARAANDWARVMNLTNEVDSLAAQLSSPEIKVQRLYYRLIKAAGESDSMFSSMQSSFSESFIAEAASKHQIVKSAISRAESAYGNGDYDAAYSALDGNQTEIFGLPPYLAVACASASSSLKDSSGRQMPPSGKSMLDSAKTLFERAAPLYSKASESLKSEKDSEADGYLSQARLLFSSAMEKVSSAKAEEPGRTDLILLLLVAVPAVVAVLLFLTIKVRAPKAYLKCSVSKASLKAGEEAEIERKIEFINPEEEKVYVRITDTPPHALPAVGFSMDPFDESGEQIVWEANVEAKDRLAITYTLSVPKLQAGWPLKIPAAAASYDLNGAKKSFIGKSFDIKIV